LSVYDFNWQSFLRFQMEINTVLHARPESAGDIITADLSKLLTGHDAKESVVWNPSSINTRASLGNLWNIIWLNKKI